MSDTPSPDREGVPSSEQSASILDRAGQMIERGDESTWALAIARAHRDVMGSGEEPIKRDGSDTPALIRAVVDSQEDNEGIVLFIAPGTREQSRAYALALAEMWDLHLRKTAGYSGHSKDVWANFRTMEALGVPDELGVFIRMNDKFNRLKSLVQDPRRDLVNEPIEDLLRDIAAYAIIALQLRKESAERTEARARQS